MYESSSSKIKRASRVLMTLATTRVPNREKQLKYLKNFNNANQNQLTPSEWESAKQLALSTMLRRNDEMGV